jgi:DNA-binding NarL/FixJ family response regulator
VFVSAVDAVARGERFVSEYLAACLLADADARPLGQNDVGSLERDVLRAFAQGDSRDEVIHSVGIDEPRLASLLAVVWAAAGRRRAIGRLTERERAVVALVARGMTHKAIAREMGISTVTVPDYLKSIKRKWDATHPDEADVTPMTACRRFAEELNP